MAHSADVNATANCGNTPLHFAAAEGYADLAELLIAHGADVNIRDGLGCTPLRWAVLKRHPAVAKLLRQHDGRE